MAERDRDREIVDDVQDRHDQNEGHVVPVGDVDVRLLAASQRAQIDDEIGHPHDHQPDVRIPFRLGVFLRLRDAHHVAGDGEHAEQIVAEQHEPRAQLIGQPRARRSLQNIKRCRDQRIAAEAEDHRGGVHRPNASEARPGGVERQIRIDEQPGNPVADEQAEHDPDHRENDAHLARIVVISVEPIVARLR